MVSRDQPTWQHPRGGLGGWGGGFLLAEATGPGAAMSKFEGFFSVFFAPRAITAGAWRQGFNVILISKKNRKRKKSGAVTVFAGTRRDGFGGNSEGHSSL